MIICIFRKKIIYIYINIMYSVSDSVCIWMVVKGDADAALVVLQTWCPYAIVRVLRPCLSHETSWLEQPWIDQTC